MLFYFIISLIYQYEVLQTHPSGHIQHYTIQSLSGKPTHTLHDPHQPTALTLKVKLPSTDFPRAGGEKSLASTQRGHHALRPLLGFVP